MPSPNQIQRHITNKLNQYSVPTGYVGDLELSPHLHQDFTKASLKEAAILLLLIVENNRVSILLTKRALHLRDYPGEWSFPGGKQDKSDKTKINAALREAQEEVGLPADEVHIIGQLPDYHALGGFNITPVIGLIDRSIDYQLNQNEVSGTLHLPISCVYNVNSYCIFKKDIRPAPIGLRGIQYGDHEISGATAGILTDFRKILTFSPRKIQKDPFADNTNWLDRSGPL